MKKKDENEFIELINQKYDKKVAESISKNIEDLFCLNIHANSIISDIELFKEIYIEKIFNIAEFKYNEKLKNSKLFSKLEILKAEIEHPENRKHNLIDEISLLFYVGIYHKIENYEIEILQQFNNTNFKDLYKLGIDIHQNKKIFITRNRLRLITNSIKHNRFYPKKELLEYYPYLNVNTKITLNDFNPEMDYRLAKSYILLLNSLIIKRSLIITLNNLQNKENLILKIEELFSEELEFDIFMENEADFIKFGYLKK
ncbi:hypothetical protein [Wenyingzhuangia sp. 2_MG-2023]|uniref:hypothetical protein n=1 Tax=Wenyingzhuangia sp. 2_MG-2023 TaxID=3062639 RepID=UPI0026E24B2A|nr:hypothetical protein [Wenyingzhuangia sp. 2_MG-2023]MDO6738578.1 hypothetical protein [Wenyingzhuangia sp. 2_MG-2023]